MAYLKKINYKVCIVVVMSLFLVSASNSMLHAAPKDLSTVHINLNPDPNTATQLPQKPVTHKKKSKKETANIYLNFENATLTSVLNYLSEEKKLNILPHKELETVRVSLSTRTPLTLERAWNVLLTLLEMNGFSIINVNNLYRVVQNKDNTQEPLPMYSSKNGTEPENLPDSDLIIRYVYFFNNIKAEMAQGILSTMLEGDRNLIVNSDLNACILKEKSLNIKAAMKIIKELDNGGLRESIQIINLKEADVDTVQKLFEEILGGEKEQNLRFAATHQKKSGTFFSTDTRIIPDHAKNSLILLGTKKNLDRIVHFINTYIDVPVGSAESRLHIKEVRYAKAETLAPILSKIILPPKGQGSDKSVVIGRYKFFEDVIIAAETSNGDDGHGSGNRLIIACNNDDWKRLDELINKLDKPQPQVAFEVLLIDVGETQEKSLGAQLKSNINSKIGAGVDQMQTMNLGAPTNLTDPLINLATGEQNSPTFLSLATGTGAKKDIWAIIKSVLQVKHTHIIAQPYLVTNNFQECTFDFSETQNVNGPLRTEKGENKVPTKVPKTAGTILTITPQINLNGIVDLKIDVSIDEFSPVTNLSPTITRRHITTKSSMMSGEVLVLGGLKASKETVSINKTPILGDIPLIGALFRSKSKTKTEENLYVFIRPSIIKPHFEGAPDDYTQLKLDYAKYQMMKNDHYVKDRDPIQRWFFKPSNHSIKKTIADARNGIFKPIDDFTYGKTQPKSIDIKHDPYYKVTASIEESRAKLKSRKKSAKN